MEPFTTVTVVGMCARASCHRRAGFGEDGIGLFQASRTTALHKGKSSKPSKGFQALQVQTVPPSPIPWSILESLGGCAFANTGKRIQTGADACSQPYTTAFLRSGIKLTPQTKGSALK